MKKVRTQTKRVLSVLLAVVMLVCAVPVMNLGLKASAGGLTWAEFNKKLEDARNLYPHGTNKNTYEWYVNGSVVGWECHGYGRWLSWYVWGEDFRNGNGTGWSRLEATATTSPAYSVRPGDVVRYRNSANHTIFVTSVTDDTIYFTDNNRIGKNTIAWDQSMPKSTLASKLMTKLYSPGKEASSTGYGYIARYDFNNLSFGSLYADLGEQFYALILNTNYWKPISLNTSTDNITLETEKNVEYQKWRFTRQDDKAYVIESCANGKVLEMTNGEREGRTQLTAHDDWWGGYYQQWYLIPQGDGYVFQSKHYTGENWVMDLRGSSDADGTPIQIYQRNDNYADDETWTVYKIDDYSTSPNVRTNKSIYPFGSDVQVTWDYCVGATSYSLVFWKAREMRAGQWIEPHQVESIEVNKSATSYTYRPPEDGGYTIIVTANGLKTESRCKFSVNPLAIDLGEDFFAEIVNTSTNRIIGNFDNNVQASSNEANDPRLIWHFMQNDDGSYLVYNTYNSALLTAENSGTTSGDNIICQTNYVGASQHWIVTQKNGVDCLVSSSGKRLMSLKGASPEPGSNVYLWTDNGPNGTAAQGFTVVKKTDYARPDAPDAPELSINSLGSQNTDTVFTWTASPLKSTKYDRRTYNLRIWQGSELGVNGTEYAHVFDLTETTCNVRLPKGNYTAYLTAANTKYHWFSTPSNSITFTIGNHSHNWVETVTKNATCIATGTKTFTCSCGESYTETISINSNNHVNTTNVSATASTCTVKGYSAGVYCNDCKRYVGGHEAQPLAPNNHVNTMNVAATPSTCTTQGYSFGVYCNDCKKYISGHEAQPLAAHQTTLINAKAATYDATGYTGDQYCAVCKQTITYGTVIPKLTKPDEPTNPTQPTNPAPQPQPQPSGGCAYCGQTHTGFPGILIGFFHSILALFGLRK